MRLLFSNKHFHEGKAGTYEEEANNYIISIIQTMKLDINQANYKQLKERIASRHTQGVDLATLVLRNKNIQRIA